MTSHGRDLARGPKKAIGCCLIQVKKKHTDILGGHRLVTVCGKQASVTEELCAMANVKSWPWLQVKIAQCSRGHSPARPVDPVQDCVCLLLDQKCENKTPGQILAIGQDFRDLSSGSGGTSAHMKDGAIHFPHATGTRSDVSLDIVNQTSLNGLGQTISPKPGGCGHLTSKRINVPLLTFLSVWEAVVHNG